MYYQYMSGNNNNDARSLSYNNNGTNLQSNRTLEDNLQSEWWSNIQSSMNTVKAKHKNVDFYIINSQGHCSFGLYYPLQEEGFEAWASPIAKEQRVVGSHRPSAVAFFVSMTLGALLVLAVLASIKQKNETNLLEDGVLESIESTRARRMPAFLLKIRACILHQSSRYSSWPWTAAYLLTCTVYFLCMILIQGFSHPLENPTLGPSAVGLSMFGINNPSLVVYKMEHYRLFTSTILCSGVMTYLIVIYSMYRYGRVLEMALLQNGYLHWVFAMIVAMISIGVNLIYACVCSGASCVSLALVVGLNVFSGMLQRRFATLNLKIAYPTCWGFTMFIAVIGSTPLFAFDSVVAILVSVVMGVLLAFLVFDDNQSKLIEAPKECRSQSESTNQTTATIRWNFAKGTSIVYFIMSLLILFRVPSPNKRNVYPYLTGCNLVYSDQIGDFVQNYASNYAGRRLEEGNNNLFGQDMCAQLCVPHLVHRPLVWGVNKFGLMDVKEGTCEENGYDVHVVDKTVREYTVTLEVQVFTQSEAE
jgi:hypothetical protein